MAEEHSPEASITLTDRLSALDVRINVETLLYLVIILIAIATRFYNLGERVMSHDETTHVYFSWLLSEGKGYQHDPLSHGPLQFHLIALSYILFGDTDAAARAPAALFGVFAVGMMWLFRRYLGRTAAFTGALLMLISPYMLYYARYARNEALVVPFALLTVWSMFRYLESRQSRWLYVMALSTSLHFATKETAFIYTAQVLIFLGGYLTWRLVRQPWERRQLRYTFLTGFALSASGAAVAIVRYFIERAGGTEVVSETLEQEAAIQAAPALSSTIAIAGIVAIFGLILIALALFFAYGKRLRTEFPCLDMLVVLSTMTLPQLAALPATLIGWDPLAYQDNLSFNRTVTVVIVLVVISAVVGLLWDWRRWLVVAGVFYIPFIVLYTTVFTNGQGLATGLVGSLGYWLVQHGVQRGSQPHFYYALIQLPIYEFLPLIGAILAVVMGPRLLSSRQNEATTEEQSEIPEQAKIPLPVVPFIGYWAITSLVGYSFAGERMPWLTVHITLPLILLAAWGIGWFVDSIHWHRLREGRGWIVAILIILLVFSCLRTLGSLLGPNPPFQGKEISQLSSTMGFLSALIVTGAAAIALGFVAVNWSLRDLGKLGGLIILAILAMVTARSAFRAAFINYDEATEFLVYAHMAKGPKTALKQIEDLSMRMTGGLDIEIAYDNETTYPFWWYLRDYNKALFFGSSPSRDLLNYPVVLAGDANWGKIDQLLQDNYYSFEYTRIWWPNQDYFQWSRSSIRSQREAELRAKGLTEIPPMNVFEYLARFWGHLKPFLFDPQSRHAAWDIWFNRDFTAYGQLTGVDYALTNWNPSNRMKLYIRKDITALLWDYGVVLPTPPLQEYIDPYAELLRKLSPDVTIGETGTLSGQFSKPRGLAVAPDGSIYVADSMNHRIQHLSPSGEVLGMWGEFAAGEQGQTPGGTFNEPWGVSVAPDGTIYVADTWNHRIQHFTAEGEFLDTFGHYGQAESPDAFWGPRDAAIDSQGRLFVADTGNKRIVVFDSSGQPMGEFGGFGIVMGTLDEPVGLAISQDGLIYVADTWNQRIQVFADVGDSNFEAVSTWDISGWYGQSLDNKPYLAVGPDGNLCATDPEGPRVLCFNPAGEFITGWGETDAVGVAFGNLVGIGIDPSCGVWVSDSDNGRILRFQLDFCRD
jgi:uncharacterized protein (TIGR03663 family)